MNFGVFASSNPFKVTDASVTSKTSDVTGDVTSVKTDKVTSNVIFHKLDDNVSYKMVIKNNENQDITITSCKMEYKS